MSQIVLSPNNAGTAQYTIAAPGTSTNRTLTLPDATTTLVGTDATQTLTNKTIQGGALTLATAQASTSGTFIDFTGIPSWAKRITVMFSGVSLSGTSSVLVQIGAGSVTITGYVSGSFQQDADASSTAGFIVRGALATDTLHGRMEISLLNPATYVWTENHAAFRGASVSVAGGGSVTLGGTLDRVRITTANGTDTFDAGSINIMYEG